MTPGRREEGQCSERVKASDYLTSHACPARANFRVSFHEPAKYVAKIRARLAATTLPEHAAATDLPIVILRTAMSGGHGAASGAGDRLADRADKVGFLLWALAEE